MKKDQNFEGTRLHFLKPEGKKNPRKQTLKIYRADKGHYCGEPCTMVSQGNGLGREEKAYKKVTTA